MKKGKYSIINDYELLYLAKENNEDAINMLFNKYKYLLMKKAHFYSNENLNCYDDYLNEAYYIFYVAIETFDDRNVFTKYLELLLDSKLKNYNKKIKANNKLYILNDDNIFSSIGYVIDTETKMIEEEEYQNRKNIVMDNLSWNEQIIFSLKEEGYFLNEIASILDVDIKNIYNAINRIKGKINKLEFNL